MEVTAEVEELLKIAATTANGLAFWVQDHLVNVLNSESLYVGTKCRNFRFCKLE